MTRLASAVCVVFAFTAFADAQPTIRFARTPAVSPDGATIAFSYLGDIWAVSSSGGVARHITMHPKHDINPVYSPDGKLLAFSSNRYGSYDIFVVSAKGGKPMRLTYDSAEDHVTGWSSDGRFVLFSSSRDTSYPFNVRPYKISAGGGRVFPFGLPEGREAVVSQDAGRLAYVRGPGAWYRKGYRGSANDDIWVCDANAANNYRMTTFNGRDASPMWSPNGRTLYYVSEQFGSTANIVQLQFTNGNGNGEPVVKQLTFHKDDSVRRAQISGDGKSIVYECGAEIWLLSTETGKSRPVAIEVYADYTANPETTTTFTSQVTEFTPSPPEDHIAFVVHGEIFLMRRTGGKATQLTSHPAYDHQITWSPDGRQIIFASDRNGFEDLYVLESDDALKRPLWESSKFRVRPLTDTPDEERGVLFSPNGKRVAFIRTGRLYTMNPDGSDVKALVNEHNVFDYEWSPNSKWICFARTDGSFASELYVVPADGATKKNPVRNITRFATFNGGITWSRTGNKLSFISRRIDNTPSAYVLSLDNATSPTATESDWEDVHLRVRQPSSKPIYETAISRDGNHIAFRAKHDGFDLWVASTNGGSVDRLTTGSVNPKKIRWSRRLSSLLYFTDGNGRLHIATVGTATKTLPIKFQAKLTIIRANEFLEIFDQSWRALNDYFYDDKFHGADWRAVRARYRPLVQHCVMKEDLYALISLMLGELNASHLGIKGDSSGPSQPTAELGVLFDHSYTGPGWKIREVVPRGPGDQRNNGLNPGDVVLSIDDVPLTPNTNLAKLLNHKQGDEMRLVATANPADPRGRRKVTLKPISHNALQELMYQQWVKKNGDCVRQWSNGKLGYIHLRSMNEASLNEFVRSLYSDNFGKVALVLDVRFNSGGFTHDQVLNYLVGKQHTLFKQRHGGQGMVLNAIDRKWTKPMVLLMNNRSFSDAEIFAHAFRTMRLGKLVGERTGGHVIGTRTVTLIDGSSFRLPRVRISTADGENLENNGVSPDVGVSIHPNEMMRDEDPQLKKAVETLLK